MMARKDAEEYMQWLAMYLPSNNNVMDDLV